MSYFSLVGLFHLLAIFLLTEGQFGMNLVVFHHVVHEFDCKHNPLIFLKSSV